MKRKQLSRAIHGVLAMSLLAGTGTVMAQDAAPAADGPKTTTLEGIKVTARKREETLQEVCHAKRCIDPAAQLFPALCYGCRWLVSSVDRLVDQEPRLLLNPRFLLETHTPRKRDGTRIYRALHGLAPHGF